MVCRESNDREYPTHSPHHIHCSLPISQVAHRYCGPQLMVALRYHYGSTNLYIFHLGLWTALTGKFENCATEIQKFTCKYI